MTTSWHENTFCTIKILSIDDEFIYECDHIDLTSTVLELKTSLHQRSILNHPPPQQQILFNKHELHNTTTFQQIYEQNNKNPIITLHAIRAKTPQFSAMHKTIESTYQYHADILRIPNDDAYDSHGYHSLDIDENASNASPHRLSSPFFARHGSCSMGPCSLRFLLLTERSQSPTPYNDNLYQPIPNTPQHNGMQSPDANVDDYYQRNESIQTERRASVRKRGSKSRLSITNIEHEWKLQNDWKTSFKGIVLIGAIWVSSSHTLYCFSALSVTVMESFGILMFDIGLLYFFTFLGVSIGIIVSSIILNEPSMIQSSQMLATYAIFVMFLSQTIVSVVFYYIYYGDCTEITSVCWYILMISRFLLGIAIGFIETALDNLLFEWFVIVDEAYFTSSARPWTLLCKEFGHGSARLILVPLVYCTLSDKQNMFFSFVFGAVLCGLAWLFMICAAVKDSKTSLDRMVSQQHHDEEQDDTDVGMSDETLSPLSQTQEKPLLQYCIISKNEWIMKQIALDVLSFRKWHQMGYDGANKSVFLSIFYLSLNFGISFCFIVLSIVSFCEQYGYTDYTSNLLLCLVPLINVSCSGCLREYILSPLKSEWIVACIGWIMFSIIFSLLAWLNIYGSSSVWLPIVCIVLFVIGYECFTAAGYELLLSSTKRDIHGLISSINSTTNYFVSAVFVILFSILVIEDDQSINIVYKYQSAYSFLAFASYFNLLIIVLLKICHSDSV